MFFGEFSHQIDEKGRMRIPAKLKTDLKNEFVITKGTNGCLFVFNKTYFENQFLNKLMEVPTFDLEAQKPIRALLSSSFEVMEDAHGRFLLPLALKEFAKINKNVVFVGVGNRIEIWSEENWNVYLMGDSSFDKVLSNLGQYNV